MKRHEVRITGIRATTLAMFEGVFAGVIGFAVAVVAWLGLTWHYAAATNSLLRGLLWGLAPGLLSVIVNTIIYFAVGWIIGIIHGFLFNLVTSWMAGIVVGTQEVETPLPAATATSAPRRAEPTFGETIDRRRRDL